MRLREWAQQLLDPDVTVQKPIAKKHSKDQNVCNANMNNCSKPRPVQNRDVCKHAPRELTYEGGRGGGGRGRKKYQVWGDVTVTPCETPWKETFRLPHVGFLPSVAFP